jgi:hypothetical protein
VMIMSSVCHSRHSRSADEDERNHRGEDKSQWVQRRAHLQSGPSACESSLAEELGTYSVLVNYPHFGGATWTPRANCSYLQS